MKKKKLKIDPWDTEKINEAFRLYDIHRDNLYKHITKAQRKIEILQDCINSLPEEKRGRIEEIDRDIKDLVKERESLINQLNRLAE